jgi:hypothetical protein
MQIIRDAIYLGHKVEMAFRKVFILPGTTSNDNMKRRCAQRFLDNLWHLLGLITSWFGT